MKKLLFTLLMLLSIVSTAQLGKYGASVTHTITPVWDCTPNTTYTISVTVDNFNQCSGNLIDAVEVALTGNWQGITYISEPDANWKNASQTNDEPAGWLGWGYNSVNPPSKTWDDIGSSNTGPLVFVFSVTTPVSTDPCWLALCPYKIDINVFGDGDTGGSAANCPTQGTPDGPYNIIDTGCGASLDLELLYFECRTMQDINILTWRTAFEKNIKGFLIEYSCDMILWKKYMTVPAIGLNKVNDYKFYSRSGCEYYRLSEITMSGKVNLLSMITCDNIDITYPNVPMDIYDLSGRVIHREVYSNQFKSLLSSGIYIKYNPKTKSTKIFQQK